MKVTVLASIFLLLFPELYSQNVGIGTTTPNRAKLEVHGDVNTNSAIFGGDSCGISLQRNWPGIGFNSYYNGGDKYMARGYAGKQLLDPGAGYMAFDFLSIGLANTSTNGLNRAMTIANNGNVALNASPVNASLYVRKKRYGTVIIKGTEYDSHFCYGGYDDANNERTYINGGKPGSKVFINDIPFGNVFFGVGATTVRINQGDALVGQIGSTLSIEQVDGRGIRLTEPSNNNNNWEQVVVRSGDGSDLYLQYNGLYRGSFDHISGNYFGLSDKRYKTNIQELPAILTNIMRLQPVTYQFKVDNPGNKEEIGFIAQRVKEIFPSMVNVLTGATGYNDLKNLHTINYADVSVLAVKSIQEQQVLITRMQKENAALLERITAVEKLLAQYKK